MTMNRELIIQEVGDAVLAEASRTHGGMNFVVASDDAVMPYGVYSAIGGDFVPGSIGGSMTSIPIYEIAFHDNDSNRLIETANAFFVALDSDSRVNIDEIDGPFDAEYDRSSGFVRYFTNVELSWG